MPDGATPDLFSRAHRVGVWCWCERRLFEQLGAWAGDTEHAASSVFFGEMSRRHGWHAELLFDRLPELSALDASSLVAAPGEATAALFDDLDASSPTALTRLVAVHRVVLPLLVAQYREALDTVSSVAEPSLGRWLGIVLRDDLEEWSRAQLLLATQLTDEAAVRAAHTEQLRLDLAVLATSALTR